ncbi:hypothetical protein PUR71_39570 [Streptomyces sp. SP17BM10]|uniref:hypothetical protein n=1 Tax=Streptomyces sp. SP17BM10 TaxID=3002530 RepID=UPI002E76D57B|nr:hypothetical protein [Streptomyces sp. SP17BM10]MEE1788958.1 hypothetical protein [Streptomyces sp. SP17BM10]
MTAPAAIRPLAAVHLREALTAAANSEPAAALAALMHIDPDSWTAIQQRAALLGTDLIDLLATAARTGGTP